jgi:GDPmannose 4,6-dehydratase/GDP-4-dehydro-6-deoxy-D-mannose reductase
MIRNFKRCLITGIGGSGGSYLTEHILKKKKNLKIFGFYRSKGYTKYLKKKFKNQVKFFSVDLNNFNLVKKKIKLIKPDVIFHLASNANVQDSFLKPMQIINNNNQITLNLLESVRVLKIDPLIIICSSSEVYGNVPKKRFPIKENEMIRPINPYAASKAFQDIVSQVYYKCYGLKIIITRMITYTNARRKNLFQTNFASQILKYKNKKIKHLNHGNLNSKRSILDIYDAMEAYWLAATSGKIGQIYNIGGKKIISVKEYLNKLIKFSKVRKLKLKKNSNLVRPVDITAQIPSVRLFKKDTLWREKVNLNSSILNLFKEIELLNKNG